MAFDLRLAALGLNRFGLGPRPGDLDAAASDPRAFLAAEVTRRAVVMPASPDLLDTPAALAALREQRQERRLEKALAGTPTPGAAGEGAPMVAGEAPAPASGPPKQPARPMPPVPQRLYRAEAAARVAAGLEPPGGFVERLVWFWSNHFAVSAAKGGPVRATAGAFEREAIRPHVLGRFADMLLAVETHPAMLVYLDNQQSIGPDSRAGQRRGKGLNENLAREILELHTLGVDGGYTQGDVTSLARIITGWTVAGPDGRLGLPGTFVFNPNWHEPGGHVLLGRPYPDAGVEQGRAALLDLARHPATARHVAVKLARHFVADDPPPALVTRLTRVFRDTDGDLSRLALALLDAPEAWSPEARKMRSPQEFLIASLRLLGAKPDNPNPILGALAALGQPLWAPPGPNGYPDTVAQWASPEGLKTRLDVAVRMAGRTTVDPMPLLEASLGPLASPETRQAVARAESRPQAVALLLMAPEFQRR